ncbi:hypothetical protein PG988_007858 [Apiospora saccharicola]
MPDKPIRKKDFSTHKTIFNDQTERTYHKDTPNTERATAPPSFRRARAEMERRKAKYDMESRRAEFDSKSDTVQHNYNYLKLTTTSSAEDLRKRVAELESENLQLKPYIEVDNIEEITWDQDAFGKLALRKDSKELIEALVTNQIDASVGTDIVAGKGNGLILLLHGGPGTGKTFTAESIADLAKKPLYRVTCGDIGTNPEQVETIQLSLHYPDLTKEFRLQIWRNFIDRLETFSDRKVRCKSLRKHIDSLAEVEMNGRQIRNTITTARQLANFKKKKLGYRLLKRVMKVSGEFDEYIQQVRSDLLDTEVARVEGLR